MRTYILNRDNGKCRIGATGCTQDATHVDHIIPKENGGTDEETNLRAACESCNLGRNKGRGNTPHEPEPKRVTQW